MKTLRLSVVVVGAALLLLSCYAMPTQTTGKIQFAVSPQSRSITAGSNLLRVSLFSVKSIGGNWVPQSLYTFPGGQAYAQGSVGSTLTLNNIPVGNWAVLVSAGAADSSGNFITTDYNWPYSVVSVAPGVDNPVSVTLQPSPIVPTSLFGTNVPGVVNVAGTVYSASTGQLYTVSGSAASAVSGVTAPAGAHTNALSSGWVDLVTGGQSQAVFVNTNQGIYYYYSGATAAQSDLAASNPISILQSGAFRDAANNNQVVMFYENENGFGGAYVNGLPYTSSMWVNVDLRSEIASQPISDLTLTNNATGSSYAYFASKLGAFQIDQTVVNTSSPNQGNIGVAKFFAVPDGSSILSLNAVGTGSDPFYIGSTSGAWSATLSEASTPPVLSPTKITATSGDSIVKIASISVIGAAAYYFVAFLSQYNLYILNTQTGAVKTYPFYAGLPGQLTGMAWSATGPTLYISGKSGVTGTPGLVSISGSYLP